jgi:hypothetical protein
VDLKFISGVSFHDLSLLPHLTIPFLCTTSPLLFLLKWKNRPVKGRFHY